MNNEYREAMKIAALQRINGSEGNTVGVYNDKDIVSIIDKVDQYERALKGIVDGLTGVPADSPEMFRIAYKALREDGSE